MLKKMRQCRLNFADNRYDCEAGIIGEHYATELIVTPPAIMPTEAVYRLCFEPGGLSEIILQTTDGAFSYPLPSAVTATPCCCVTLIGYVGSEQIYKSRMVRLHFSQTADGDADIDPQQPGIIAEVNRNTAARHLHSNKAILDKFAETDGKPTYDGEAIGGENTIYIPATLNMSGDSPTIETSVTFEQIDTAYKSGQEQILKVFFDDSGVDSYLMSTTMASPGNFYYFGINVGENSMLAFVTSDNYWGFIMYNLTTHTHDNKTVLDKLSVAGGKLQYNGSDVELRPSQVTSGTTITLADNTEYRLTDVTTLTLNYPVGDFECWMRLSFAASGNVTVTLPAGTGYIGSAPDFKNGETWELSFKDKILAAQKVGDGT